MIWLFKGGGTHGDQDKLRYPIRVEKWDNKGEISWLHIDISPNTHGKKLYFFKA